MKLHRASGQPDWATVEAGSRNFWQRLAAATRGVVTPGNFVTAVGFVVVLAGLGQLVSRHYWLGGIELALGRGLDIADGWLAEFTATKSPLGEALDATLDKVGTFLTLIVFLVARVASWWVVLGLAIPQVVNAGLTLHGRRQHIPLHPSRLGKLSMAAAWISLLGFGLRQALGVPMLSLDIAVYTVTGLSVAMGMYVALGYASEVSSH